MICSSTSLPCLIQRARIGQRRPVARPFTGKLVVRASFNFAESERVKRTWMNRTSLKKHAQEVVRVVKGLCTMSSKQLQAVSHLLTEQQRREIDIALRIPATNQGRKRQENLIAKILRTELDEAAFAKLATAVDMAQQNNIPFVDMDLEQQLDIWVEGLIANDQEVAEELLPLVQAAGLDWQQIRTWVRQCSSSLSESEASSTTNTDTSTSSSSSSSDEQGLASSSDSSSLVSSSASTPAAAGGGRGPLDGVLPDPELLEVLQARRMKQQQQQGKKSGKQKSSGNGAAAARRALRKCLRPLASS